MNQAGDPLDREILEVHEQSKASSHRHETLPNHLAVTQQLAQRSALSSVILASSSVAALSRTNPTLAELRTRNSEALARQARRSTLATTIFTTKDPDPFAPDSGIVTGIRIERYSRKSRQFLAPAYAFLQREKPSEDSQDQRSWRVHRHTLPPSVPVHALASTLLNGSADDGQAAIRKFARAVTKEVLSLLRRQEAAAELKGGQVKEVKVLNGEATEVGLVLRDGSAGSLRVTKTGRVEKVKLQEGDAETAQLARRMQQAGTIEAIKAAVG